MLRAVSVNGDRSVSPVVSVNGDRSLSHVPLYE